MGGVLIFSSLVRTALRINSKTPTACSNLSRSLNFNLNLHLNLKIRIYSPLYKPLYLGTALLMTLSGS